MYITQQITNKLNLKIINLGNITFGLLKEMILKHCIYICSGYSEIKGQESNFIFKIVN